MSSAFRDPKSLPEWIELDYYNRPRPIRWQRRVLGWSILFLTAGLLVLVFLWGSRRIYQGGPVSDAHRMFNDDCSRCHTEVFQTAKRLLPEHVAFRSVPDTACQQCHLGATHHAQQVTMPGSQHCADCHQEHRGRVVLSLVPDRHCLACHEDLKRLDGKPSAFANLASFGTHPEFWWLREGTKRPDPGRIKFNHAVHLAEQGVYMPDPEQLKKLWKDEPLAGPVRQQKKLSCGDCHQPDAQGRYMLPISFEQHCKACHGLPVHINADLSGPALQKAAREFQQIPASHPKQGESPAVVRAELRDRFTRFIQQHPEALRPAAAAGQRPVPGWERNLVVTKEEHEWVNREVTNAWRVLTRSPGGCEYCHWPVQGEKQSDDLPQYALPQINQRDFPPARLGKTSERWLPHGLFRHDSHRMLECTECHDARTNKDPAVVLLPGIATCQKCHNPSVGARSDCVECHRYHDREKERAFVGDWKLDKILGGK